MYRSSRSAIVKAIRRGCHATALGRFCHILLDSSVSRWHLPISMSLAGDQRYLASTEVPPFFDTLPRRFPFRTLWLVSFSSMRFLFFPHFSHRWLVKPWRQTKNTKKKTKKCLSTPTPTHTHPLISLSLDASEGHFVPSPSIVSLSDSFICGFSLSLSLFFPFLRSPLPSFFFPRSHPVPSPLLSS